MISMPIINRAIPSNMPTEVAPITGDAIITRANTISYYTRGNPEHP